MPGGERLPLRGQIVSRRADTALIKISNWTDAMLAVARRAATSGPPARGPAQPRPAAPEPRAGTLRNPTAVRDLAALGLRPEAAPDGAAAATLVGLLARLGRRRVSGTLRLDTAPSLEIPFERGRVALEDRARPRVLAAAMQPELGYAFDPQRRAGSAPGQRRVPAWGLVVLLVKGIIREAALDVLLSALPVGRAPRLRADDAQWLSVLELTDAERRFCERRLAGAEVRETLSTSGGLIGATRLLCLLHVIGLVDWVEPPQAQAVSAAGEVRRRYDELARAELFTVIGAHFSTAPAALKAAYQARLAEYGPGAPAQRADPAHAGKITQLVQHAWSVLAERTSRQRYRREHLRLNVAAAAHLAAGQAKMALLRGDTIQAHDLLAAALDMNPTLEYVAAWRSLAAGGEADCDSDLVLSAGHAEAEPPR